MSVRLEVRRRPALRGRTGVAGLTVVATLLYAAVSLARHAAYRTGSYDLVIFDQAVRGYARLGAPVAPVKGVHNGFGPGFSLLGDHVSPVLAAWAPLYWLRDDPTTLLVAQAVLLGASVPLVWLAARRALGARPAWLVAAAYALGWPLLAAAAVDVHEVAFAVPLTALALERLGAGRAGQAAAAGLGLVLVKEDMGLVVAALGVVLALRGARRLGVAVAAAGLLAVWVSVAVLIPAAGGRSDYYWSYDALGDDPAAAVAFALAHPARLAHLAVTPAAKWHLLLLLAAPVLLLCAASPLALLAVPLLAERLLSANPNHWTAGHHHYDAFLWPVLVLAAVDAARRLPPRWQQRWAAATLGVAVLLAGWGPAARSLDPASWRVGDRQRAAAAAVAAVPDGVTVEADNSLGPHLTRRTTVLLLDRTPRGAAWVVADTARPAFPFTSVAEQRARVALLRGEGYRTVLERGGYVVLRRGGPA